MKKVILFLLLATTPSLTFSKVGENEEGFLGSMEPFIHTLCEKNSENNPIIAVIDTGYDTTDPELEKFIYKKDGKKVEFDYSETGIHDTHGHGTNIIKTIIKVNPNARIIPIKVYAHDKTKFSWMIYGFMKVLTIDEISIVNYSSAGDWQNPIERKLIEKIIETGRVFVASAGNDALEITEDRPKFPASYKAKGMIVLAGENPDQKIFTNYSSRLVDFSINGHSYTHYEKGRYVSRSGSSISAGIVSGLLSLHKMTDKSVKSDTMIERLKLFSTNNFVTKYGSISIPNYIKTLETKNQVAEK